MSRTPKPFEDSSVLGEPVQWTETETEQVYPQERTKEMILNSGINGRAELTVRAVVSFDNSHQLGEFVSWVSDAVQRANGEHCAIARSFLQAAKAALNEADDIMHRVEQA